MVQKTQKIWSLYRITNLINGKVYIGQAADVSRRWHDHRRAVKLNKPTQAIHYALIKYGLNNFEFIVIASCKSQEDANFTETLLVSQYDSFIKNGNGYNVTLGGMNAPKTDEWKQAMKAWRNSLSEEEKAEIKTKQSEATRQQIAEKGHPAQGRVVTQETRDLQRKIRLKNPIEYTEKIRQHISEAHIGIKDSDKTKSKKAASAKEAWEKRIDYSRKCEASGCEVSGKAKYKIIDGVRYCNKHGLRMLRRGSL